MPPAEIRSDLIAIVADSKTRVASAQHRYDARRTALASYTVIAPADAECIALAEEYASTMHAHQHAVAALAATGYFEASK